MKSRDFLRQISDALPRMRKSERKVAEFVLSCPGAAVHMRIVDLASEAKVSEPTVVRFCRAAGFDGFQDFKLCLARNEGAPSFGHFPLQPGDSLAQVCTKVFDATLETLVKVREQLSETSLGAAVAALCAARRVEFYGFGASGAVAVDAQHKFFRLQVAAAAYVDPHMQSMSAMALAPGDAVVAISQSGRSVALLEAVALARQVGAEVIGICPGNSPLARACSIPIAIDVEEDTDVYTPLSSRIAHLVVIDVLATGVSMARGPELQEHLGKLKQGLRHLRLPADRA